jgi:hypothetical protein
MLLGRFQQNLSVPAVIHTKRIINKNTYPGFAGSLRGIVVTTRNGKSQNQEGKGKYSAQ